MLLSPQTLNFKQFDDKKTMLLIIKIDVNNIWIT